MGVLGKQLAVLDQVAPLLGSDTVVGVVGAEPSWEVRQGRVRLRLAAYAQERIFKLVIWNGRQEEVGGFENLFHSLTHPQDLRPLCTGGPAHWNIDLTTAGTRGKDDAAYALDTLSLPTNNPWQTSMRLAALDFFPDG